LKHMFGHESDLISFMASRDILTFMYLVHPVIMFLSVVEHPCARDIDLPQFQLTESLGKCYVEGVNAVDFAKLLFDGDGEKPDL
jgi:hypothetical protein